MPNKKTSVLLPGSISDLVKGLQSGGQASVKEKEKTEEVKEQDAEQTQAKVAEPTPEPEHHVETVVIEEASSDVINDEAAFSTSRNEIIRPASPTPSATSSSSTAFQSQMATKREDVSGRRGRKPKENNMRERQYNVVRDDSKDSWQLFLDLAHDYKVGGGKLATIYIDETLKNVLDRLKYAGDEKLSTSAILSSIVARFFYDHEKDIKDVLFKNTLTW